jgi:hypothetical protein
VACRWFSLPLSAGKLTGVIADDDLLRAGVV